MPALRTTAPTTSARDRRRRKALRDAIFRTCSALGVLLGMWTVWPTIGQPTGHRAAASCSSKAADAMSRCFSDSLGTTVVPPLVHVLTYALAGMVVGAALALTLVRRGD